MQKKVNLAMLALFSCSLAMAQNEKTDQNIAQGLDEMLSPSPRHSWARTMTCHPMSPFSILPATYTRARQVTCSRQHVSATVPSTRSTTMSISTVLP